jgi:hypothetical protein
MWLNVRHEVLEEHPQSKGRPKAIFFQLFDKKRYD